MRKKLPRVSVIIPTYNSWGTLEGCLNSIFKQTLQPIEVIVIDNASSDGTYEKIKNSKLKFKNDNSKLIIFRNRENLGVTGGRNRGIKEASKKSDYLFFFDHDMVADKKMLQELVKVAESKDIIGITTPRIYYWDNKNIIWSAGTDVNLLTGQTVFSGGEDVGQYDEIREVGVAPAAILVKKKVIEKIGGFDQIYITTYEDTDFCFRAKKHEFLTYYAPKAIAYHKIPYDTTEAEIRLLSRVYFVARNRIIFMKRYGKHFLLFLLFIPLFFSYYAYLSLKFRKPKALSDFFKGSVDGFLLK